MTPLLTDVFEWIGRYRPPDPDLTPGEIRMHQTDAYAVYVEMSGTPYQPDHNRVYGVKVTPDLNIPPGQWRVCAADGRLIHDSRSGKVLG